MICSEWVPTAEPNGFPITLIQREIPVVVTNGWSAISCACVYWWKIVSFCAALLRQRQKESFSGAWTCTIIASDLRRRLMGSSMCICLQVTDLFFFSVYLSSTNDQGIVVRFLGQTQLLVASKGGWVKPLCNAHFTLEWLCWRPCCSTPSAF